MRPSRALLLLAALGIPGAVMAATPDRVVSMNHCADQYALLVGAPGQVVSVTHVATDPNLSLYSDLAEGLVLNRGGAEEVYRLDPDLVLASQWSDPMAVGLLDDLGVRVERVDGVERLADIPSQIRRLGGLLGREAEAVALAGEVERRLAAVEVPEGERPVAAFFGAGGYSLGEGSLAHDILRHAGFDNLAGRVGRSDGGYLAVEVLLMNRPDLLLTSGVYPGSSQAEAVMAHPALADIPRVEIGPEWSCGLPAALDAVEALVDIRKSLKN